MVLSFPLASSPCGSRSGLTPFWLRDDGNGAGRRWNGAEEGPRRQDRARAEAPHPGHGHRRLTAHSLTQRGRRANLLGISSQRSQAPAYTGHTAKELALRRPWGGDCSQLLLKNITNWGFVTKEEMEVAEKNGIQKHDFSLDFI